MIISSFISSPLADWLTVTMSIFKKCVVRAALTRLSYNMILKTSLCFRITGGERKQLYYTVQRQILEYIDREVNVLHTMFSSTDRQTSCPKLHSSARTGVLSWTWTDWSEFAKKKVTLGRGKEGVLISLTAWLGTCQFTFIGEVCATDTYTTVWTTVACHCVVIWEVESGEKWFLDKNNQLLVGWYYQVKLRYKTHLEKIRH